MSSVSRTILRRAARIAMEEGGFTRIRKQKVDDETGKKYSTFSKSWRTYAPHKVDEPTEE